jgi:3-oxoacyl-[acyl-carrier protein] reductase
VGSGQIAVVTGAGSGIGRRCAERLAARGLHVVVAGRTAATLAEVVTAIEGGGGAATAVVADCATDDGRAALLAATAAVGSPVAAFVHAAGADLVASLAETTADQLDELLAINVRAPFLLTQALAPTMADGAGIVYVGSISATRGRPRHAAYGASKAALIGLTANLAAELGPRLRVNCVSPGATRTGMLRTYVRESMRGLSDDERARLAVSDAARMPLGRVAEPDEVAIACVHLALDATATTGVDLPVDVGYTAT